MTKKILKEGLDWKFGNQWILLTFLSISQPRLWSLPDAHWPWQPGPCPLTWNSSWNTPWPVSSHQAASWPSSEPQLRLKASRSPPTWVSCFSSQAPQLPVLLTIMVFTLFYNGPFMCLFPALPDWELRQTREHVLLMAESASLGHSGHTVNLLTKRTNNWIRAPLLSVATNQGKQRTDATQWLHWLFLKLPHPRLQVGPPSLQLFRAVFTSPCSHAFICAFAKGKCSSWAGHLVMGDPAEQSRWHQALHPLCPMGEGLLCLLVTSSLTHNLIYSQSKVPTATLKDILSDIQFNN